MYITNAIVYIDVIIMEVLISINEACRIILYTIESPFYLELCTSVILVKLYIYIISIYKFNNYGVWLSPPRFTLQSFEQKSLKRISTAIANSTFSIVL